MRIATLLLLATFGSGCAVEREVARVASPDGSAEAFVIELNGGATTSFGYDVYLGKVGSSPFWATEVASLYGARRNELMYGVNLRWDSPDTLAVEYLSAIKAQLKQPRTSVRGRQRTTVLRDGIDDRAWRREIH